MKAITIKPNWAELIASDAKRVENRSWRTRHRGPLLIHAAQPTGAIVAVVDLIDLVPVSEVAGQPYAEGPWCWLLANVKRVTPIRWRGQQKLFDVPGPR